MIDQVSGWVLDTAALLAVVDRHVYAQSVLALAHRYAITLVVPLPALSEAYDLRPTDVAGPRLAQLLNDPLLLAIDLEEVPPELLTKLSDLVDGDRVAAFVAYLGAVRGWPVLTSRPAKLHQVAPALMVIPA